jgi:Tfp pilus assembly protein PilX
MSSRLFNKISGKNEQGGFILPVLLITGIMIVLMILAVASETVTNNNTAAHGNYAVAAQLAADAGLDDAMNRMNTVDGWTGTGGDVTLLNDVTHRIKTTYSVVVNNGVDDIHKTLVVTARTYSPVSAPSPKLTRKYAMDVEAVTTGIGASSVVTGVGGLVMNGNAKVAGGDVVVNGTITMSNNAQIGLSTNPVNVRVADQACPLPANSSYPQVCPAGSPEPITMGTNSFIYGNVQATNQTTGTKMFSPGLVAGATFDPIPLTSFNRAGFKNTINASGQTLTGAQASNCPNGGTVNWPANVKITGNVNIQNKCTVRINGNVWVSGSVTIQNNADFKVQNGVGSTMPDMVVDGSSGFIIGNKGSITPNSLGTSIEVFTFWSAASCSPDCADNQVTGTNLYNSQRTLTIDLSNTGSAQNAVLYSYWSKVRLSNNGSLGAVTGQTVELGNNAVINFSSSVPGSDNQVTTWVKRGYMRVYN